MPTSSPRHMTFTQYHFSNQKYAVRYGLFWALTIAANTILLRLGEDDNSLDTQRKEAADNICRTLEYYSQLAPLGATIYQTFAGFAFGVLSDERKEQLALDMQKLLSEAPIRTGYDILQNIFNLVSGGSR
jgi:hypothetical protein